MATLPLFRSFCPVSSIWVMVWMGRLSWWLIIQISEVFASHQLQEVERSIKFKEWASASNHPLPMPAQGMQWLVNSTGEQPSRAAVPVPRGTQRSGVLALLLAGHETSACELLWFSGSLIKPLTWRFRNRIYAQDWSLNANLEPQAFTLGRDLGALGSPTLIF